MNYGIVGEADFDYGEWLQELPRWLHENRESDGSIHLSKKVADQTIEILAAIKTVPLKIKSLSWTQTALRNIKHNGKPGTFETWEAKTSILGNYKVWKSISRKCFVEIPRYSEEKRTNNKHLLVGRRQCESVEHGKQIAEAHWQQHIEEVFVI